jgi:TolB-like protein/DNA-binding winged helix-turn-helix (wHTH) protein/Flp pilus assembly protein TadD
VASEPAGISEPIRFGDDFELDAHSYQLRRSGRLLKLERIPTDLLLLLVEQRGQLVTREQIIERVWGKDVFLDTDNSINAAIRKIRQVLKDDPEHPRFVQTVTGRGYRFIAPVALTVAPSPSANSAIPQPTPAHDFRSLEVPGVPAGPELSSTQHRGPENKKKLRRYQIASLVLLATLGLAIAYSRLRNRPSVIHSTGIHSLAVLPLKNLSGDPTQEYLADGMTEALVGRLANIHNLRVISRTSVMQFKDTHLSVPQIAGTLGVDALVEGSVIRDGDRIRVTAQLIRGATDDHFWSETYDRDLRDVLALESEVAQSIATKVEVTVTGEEHERLAAVKSVSPEVYESYLKGRFAAQKSNSRAGTEESIGYFEEAIKRDPTFAPAYLGLATAYGDLSTIFIGASPENVRPKIMKAVRTALELDPESADAHVLLANLQQAQWHWAEAEGEYRRALELSPNDAMAHLGLGGWMVCQGRAEEAIAGVKRGRALDPIAVSGNAVGWILFLSRRYDEALPELQSVSAVDPNYAVALWHLGYVLIAKNQPEEAIPFLEKAAALSNGSPGVIGVLVRAYAHAGRRTDALRLLAELKKRKQAGYVPAGAFVNAYLGLGENDLALVWLEQAYREQSNILQYAKVHPFFDPLRGDPRFADLQCRVGLAQ